MENTAYTIAVIESEKGWGSKVDDYMVCLSPEDALAFKTEFNAENDKDTVPDWYMYAEANPKPIELVDKQFTELKSKKRMWLSELKAIK